MAERNKHLLLAVLLIGASADSPKLVFKRADGTAGASIHFDENAGALEVPGYCKEAACGSLATSIAQLEKDVAGLKTGMAAMQADLTELKNNAPPPAPYLLAGHDTLNNFASIRHACPVGTEPLRCDSLAKYEEFLAFARTNGDSSGSKHFLANCVRACREHRCPQNHAC